VPQTPADADGTRVGLSAWAVQLSTFGNAANAIALRNALRGRGFVAFVERTPDKATRVYVGPELQRQKAVSAQERLARDLGITGTVVPYPASPAP
jgi:cell division septation protein DedD